MAIFTGANLVRPSITLSGRAELWDALYDALMERPWFGHGFAMFRQLVKTYVGDLTRYGLPEPDHKLAEAHPTVSGRILDRLAHGAITPKPNIARLEGDNARLDRKRRKHKRRLRTLAPRN